MLSHWFGGDDSCDPTTCNTSRGGTLQLQGHSAPHGSDHAALLLRDRRGSSGGGSNPPARGALSGVRAHAGLWGISRLRAMGIQHVYPIPGMAQSPLLCAEDVAQGVAAIAIHPAGDVVAALLQPCCCLVLWRLASSWTQRLANLGGARPSTHAPHAYVALPLERGGAATAARPEREEPNSCDGSAGSGMAPATSHSGAAGSRKADCAGQSNGWALVWQREQLIDVLRYGKPLLCVEVCL